MVVDQVFEILLELVLNVLLKIDGLGKVVNALVLFSFMVSVAVTDKLLDGAHDLDGDVFLGLVYCLASCEDDGFILLQLIEE